MPLPSHLPAPRVSVVIPTRDGGALLREVVAAVLAQELDEPFEVLLVDSGSRDGVPADLARGSQRVRVVDVPAGEFDHGATRNLAIGAAAGEIVALLVQDARPADRRWLARLAGSLDAEPSAAGAYARQEPRPEHPAWVREPVERHVAGRDGPRTQRLTPAAWEAASPLERLHAITFDNVASAIRKDAWRAHPFARLPFGEDVEWARRVLLSGFSILYVPGARVVHSHDRGPWYELRRNYLCHRLLRELVGLELVPDVPSLVGGAASAARRNVALGGRLRGAAVGVASVLGQFLGARHGPRLDRWLGHGV